MDLLYDVAIIGGGPAGSTAATLLAKAARRVIVLEREKFPRFHIGESLLPFSTQAFDRLGVREKLDRTFLPKFGAEIVAACGTKGVKFYFKDGFRTRRDRAYQVTRSEFDKLLLEHSRDNGAEVREETEVKKIAFEEDRIKIDIETSDGARSIIESRYLLDCSGRQTTLGNFFKLKNRRDAHPHGARTRSLVLDDPTYADAHEHWRGHGHGDIPRDEASRRGGTGKVHRRATDGSRANDTGRARLASLFRRRLFLPQRKTFRRSLAARGRRRRIHRSGFQ